MKNKDNQSVIDYVGKPFVCVCVCVCVCVFVIFYVHAALTRANKPETVCAFLVVTVCSSQL